MKPIYSEEDRYKIVLNFIAERGSGKIPIMDFSPLLRYLTDIKPLREIKKSSYPDKFPDGTYRTVGYSGHVSNPVSKEEPCYGRDDAEEYFNWLMYMLTADDKATDEQRKEAVNQLFMFIFVLRDKIKIDLSDFLRGHFEWEIRLDNIDETLKNLESSIQYLESNNETEHSAFNKDSRKQEDKIETLVTKLQQEHIDVREIDNQLMGVLERISNWQKDFQPRVEKLEKAQRKADRIFKGKPNVQKGNNQ